MNNSEMEPRLFSVLSGLKSTISPCFSSIWARSVWGVCLCSWAVTGLAEQCQTLESHIPSIPHFDQKITEGQFKLDADDATIQVLPAHPENQADSLTRYTFQGDVLLKDSRKTLKAENLTYDSSSGQIDAAGKVTLWDPAYVIQGQQAHLKTDKTGIITNTRYWLREQQAQGKAGSIIRHNEKVLTLNDSIYTGCDLKKPDWHLESQNIELNFETEMGTARDVKFYLRDIPVFYSPYLSFPLNDKRKSGLLIPKIGNSNALGVDISVPYYWNIAPNYDMTLTPRLMSRRGVSLGTEMRYLFSDHQGKFNWEYLPSDRVRNENRHLLKVQHQSRFKHLNLSLYYNEVSDDRYFEDLGSSLDISSTTHLEQRLDLLHKGRGYYLLARAQRFQTLSLDPKSRPYQRLPQILFETQLPEQHQKLHYRLRTEYVHFDRDIGDPSDPTGQRLDLIGELAYPQRWAAGFVIPKLSLRYTQYRTQDRETQSRSTPTFSMDAGLFFDRSINLNWLGSKQFTQTLEPRIYYVYTPYRDQSQMPIYDSAAYDFSFTGLFRANRYSGADRVGDENRLTLALTSRLMAQDTGTEALRLSVGQVYYFEDRQVTIDTEPLPSNSNRSHIIAEVDAKITPHLSVAQTVQWDHENAEIQQSISHVRYRSDKKHLINLSYRNRNNTLKQTDVAWHWPLKNHWQITGRWNYSLEYNNSLETFIGLGYESCCWSGRLVARRYLNNVQGDYSNGLFLQFEFKGLGGVGRKTERFLSESITGFSDNLAD